MLEDAILSKYHTIQKSLHSLRAKELVEILNVKTSKLSLYLSLGITLNDTFSRC